LLREEQGLLEVLEKETTDVMKIVVATQQHDYSDDGIPPQRLGGHYLEAMRSLVVQEALDVSEEPLKRLFDKFASTPSPVASGGTSSFMDCDSFILLVRSIRLCPDVLPKVVAWKVFAASTSNKRRQQHQQQQHSHHHSHHRPLLSYRDFCECICRCAIAVYGSHAELTVREMLLMLFSRLNQKQAGVFPSADVLQVLQLGSEVEEVMWVLFEHYCPPNKQTNARRSMSATKFVKFVRDFNLQDKELTLARIDLVFQKMNKSKSTQKKSGFQHFIAVVVELARTKKVDERIQPRDAVEWLLVQRTVAPAPAPAAAGRRASEL
jgi:hypothetical protein